MYTVTNKPANRLFAQRLFRPREPFCSWLNLVGCNFLGAMPGMGSVLRRIWALVATAGAAAGCDVSYDFGNFSRVATTSMEVGLMTGYPPPRRSRRSTFVTWAPTGGYEGGSPPRFLHKKWVVALPDLRNLGHHLRNPARLGEPLNEWAAQSIYVYALCLPAVVGSGQSQISLISPCLLPNGPQKTNT